MAREFGKSRPPPVTETTRQIRGASVFGSLPNPPVDPMQLLHGAGYCLLGYFLGMSLFGTLLPQPGPKFMRFVYVPGETRTDLINESFDMKRPLIVPPGEN